jgi:glycerate-2-kinase
METPCVLIRGGETVLTLKRNFGKGRPAQKFVASAILNRQGQEEFIVVALDTAESDGSTEAA